MKLIYMLFLVLSISISACATRYPINYEKQATFHTKQAKSLISKGDCDTAGYQIDKALSRQTGDLKVRKLFKDYPTTRKCYVLHLKKRIFDISNEFEAISILQTLKDLESKEILSKNQMDEFYVSLKKTISEGNKTDRIPFVLGYKVDLFPELSTPNHQKIIIDRTINNLQKSWVVNRPILPLIEYVDSVGVNSIEGKRIEALLSTFNIRSDELGIIGRVFPTFASNREKEVTAQVFMQVKNGDRLFKEDLLKVFKHKINGVDWVSPHIDNDTIVLTIEQLRNNEKILPEQTQTITYAHHEVNLMGAVLMMPRNASYLYDVTYGGLEIEYGYVISAMVNNKEIYDKVVRGKVDNKYSRCQNARIQNVFGGVSPAKFVANNDMVSRCNGHNSISMEDLRKKVLLQLVDGVLSIPQIKAVHELN